MLRAASSGRRNASTSARDSISLPVTSSMSLPWMDLILTSTTQRPEPYPSGNSIWRAASRRGSSTWWCVSLSLSLIFSFVYIFSNCLSSLPFFTVLVQTLRILFNFILKSCVEFVEEYKLSWNDIFQTSNLRKYTSNNLKSKSHVFAPQINHDTDLWENGCTRYKAIYVLWLWVISKSRWTRLFLDFAGGNFFNLSSPQPLLR